MLSLQLLALLTLPSIIKCRNLPPFLSTRDDANTIQADGTLYTIGASPSTDDATLQNGTRSFNEPKIETRSPICPRGSGTKTYCSDAQRRLTRRLDWLKADGTQVAIEYLARRYQDQIWDAAGVTGTALKALMDDWVGRGVSRAGAEQDALYGPNYYGGADWRSPTEEEPGKGSSDAQDVLEQAGAPNAIARDDLKVSLIYANENTGTQTVQILASVSAEMLITQYAFAEEDDNAPGKRAYSSTLQWNAWKAIAGDQAKGLKWQMQYNVANQASDNIMVLAHQRFPGNVALPQLPTGERPLPPEVGHGVWRPEDPAFVHLLAAPNVKTSLQMVVDYNPSMENPYIVAIHTWPKLARWIGLTVPLANPRYGFMLVEFGAKPSSLESAAVAPDFGKDVQR